MKSYPSIARSTGQDFQEFVAHVFDKVDGSNLRFEWNRKSGWYKYGTRNRMFDESDPVFGSAIPLFMKRLSEPLARIAKDSRWEGLIVFCEFHGPTSFAGVHAENEPKRLTLFDANPHKIGFLGPKEFMKTFKDIEDQQKFLGEVNWTRGFVQSVRAGEVEGVTFEGVVGKQGSGHSQIRAKAKTQAWIDAVMARYGDDKGKLLVES